MDLVKVGSETAKNGFQNERDICEKFENWQQDEDAQQWLLIMGYNLNEIEYVKAVVLHGFKADINVQIQVKLKTAIDAENIQIKLVSTPKGFNQIDKRWLSHYQEMWNIPKDVYELLQYYTGEKLPYRENTRDSRRMFMDEFTEEEQKKIVNWFTENSTLILSDIIRGRGQFCAEWILVAQILQNSKPRWKLVNINVALQHYSGDVVITKRGSLYIGKVTVQRKGGDGGRPTANMLQFKVDPITLFNI